MSSLAQSVSIFRDKNKLPKIEGIAIESPKIVVESARPTPRVMASCVSEASEENTETKPATVPKRPKSGAAEIAASSKNIPRSSRVISRRAKALSSSAFGDFSYYWIADREGRSFKRLDELFAATGQVGFRGSERVDGKLILPEAVKVLQQKA